MLKKRYRPFTIAYWVEAMVPMLAKPGLGCCITKATHARQMAAMIINARYINRS